MKKIATIYKSEDGLIFEGKNALQEATAHQKNFDFMKTIKDILPETRCIFNVENDRVFYKKNIEIFNGVFDDIDNFNELIEILVFIYLEVPELLDFFKFIKKQVENNQ